MTDRTPKILTLLAILFVLLTVSSGLLFYFEGDDEFGGLTGLLGFLFLVIPSGMASIGLAAAALGSWLGNRRR
jgi:hypothetical protein